MDFPWKSRSRAAIICIDATICNDGSSCISICMESNYFEIRLTVFIILIDLGILLAPSPSEAMLKIIVK